MTPDAIVADGRVLATVDPAERRAEPEPPDDPIEATRAALAAAVAAGNEGLARQLFAILFPAPAPAPALSLVAKRSPR